MIWKRDLAVGCDGDIVRSLWEPRNENVRKPTKRGASKRSHDSKTRSRSTRIGLLVAAAIIAVFVLVFVAGRFMGDDADSDTLAATEEIYILDAEIVAA